MTKEEYKKLVSKYTPKYNRLKSILIAFLVGGTIGMIGQGLIDFYSKVCNLTIKDAKTYMIVTLIFISSLLLYIVMRTVFAMMNSDIRSRTAITPMLT